MRTITPESLQTLSSRVGYTRDFVNFTADDAAALHAAKPYVAPLVPVVVDAVYVKLFEYTITAKSFFPRQTGFTGEAPLTLEELTLDHPQIKFRKDFLSSYLVKVVSLNYDDPKSWEYLDKVAIMHTGTEPGFKHRINKPALRVEYTHLGLLLGRYTSRVLCISPCILYKSLFQDLLKIFLSLPYLNTLNSISRRK
jgi:hypothetical protein